MDYGDVTEPDRERAIEYLREDDLLYDLRRGLRELAYARPEYNRAHRFYQGRIEEFSSNRRIQDILERSADAYRFRLAAVPVRVLRDRTHLTSIKVDASVQTTWDAIHKANKLGVWAPEFHARAYEYGDAYVTVWPEDDGDTPGVAISFNDPRTCRVIYDTDNERLELFAVKTWRKHRKEWAEVIYRDRIETYATGGLAAGSDVVALYGANWELADQTVKVLVDGELVDEVIPAVRDNPWGELPVKHLRTALPYGIPVHIDAYGPQSAISKMLITQLCTVDRQGWPSRYALAEPAAVLDAKGRQPDWDDDGDVEGTATTRGSSEPGMMEYFDGIKEVGSFEAADAANFTDPIELYMSLMAVVTGTPFYAFKPGGEQPSGKAREIADAPLNASLERYQALFGEGFWTDVATLALRMAGKPTKDVAIKWKPSTVATDADDWQVVKAKQDAGVPISVSLVEAGKDVDEVADWAEDAERLTATAAGVDLLAKMGSAFASLGAAANLGVVSPEAVQAIVSDLIGRIGTEQTPEGMKGALPPAAPADIDPTTGQPIPVSPLQSAVGGSTVTPPTPATGGKGTPV